METSLIGKIIAIGFALLILILFWAYGKILCIYRGNAKRRAIFGMPCIFFAAIFFIIQIKTYGLTSNVIKPLDDDKIFLIIVISEWLIARACYCFLLLNNLD